jgi:hypothetical protein
LPTALGAPEPDEFHMARIFSVFDAVRADVLYDALLSDADASSGTGIANIDGVSVLGA